MGDFGEDEADRAEDEGGEEAVLEAAALAVFEVEVGGVE